MTIWLPLLSFGYQNFKSVDMDIQTYFLYVKYTKFHKCAYGYLVMWQCNCIYRITKFLLFMDTETSQMSFLLLLLLNYTYFQYVGCRWQDLPMLSNRCRGFVGVHTDSSFDFCICCFLYL